MTDLLGDAYHVVHPEARESDGQGISIESRWPVAGLRELDLNITPRTGDLACITLIAQIEAHASVNRDFAEIVFASNWGRSRTEEVEIHLLPRITTRSLRLET